MLKHFNSEEDAVILDCAEKTQQNGGSLTKGFQNAAQKLNRTYRSVTCRYYKFLSGKAENTAKVQRTAFSQEEDSVILECVAEACKAGSSAAKGLMAAAQKLNKSYDSVGSRYRRVKNTEHSKPSIREALEKMIQKGEIPPADKEKLTRVAQLTGEHYHTVLSTFGAITACGALASKELCDWKCPWHKAATVSHMCESGMKLKQVAAWSGMSIFEVKNHIKAYQETKTAQENLRTQLMQKNIEIENLRTQLTQKGTEITVLNNKLNFQEQEVEQYRVILDALAQELGIEDWDKEPTVYFASEIHNRLTGLVSHYVAAHKLGVRLLKEVVKKGGGFGLVQARYSNRQEVQLH